MAWSKSLVTPLVSDFTALEYIHANENIAKAIKNNWSTNLVANQVAVSEDGTIFVLGSVSATNPNHEEWHMPGEGKTHLGNIVFIYDVDGNLNNIYCVIFN